MRKRILMTICLILTVSLFSACGLMNKDKEEDVTVSFEKDTVFSVGAKRVGLGEWYLYSLPEESELSALYGQELWNYNTGSETMAEAVKDDLMKQIIYTKIVSNEAERMGIVLSEEELEELEYHVQKYYGELSSDIREKYGITKEDIRTVYTDNILAKRVYERLTLNVDTSIPEEDVRHVRLQYVMIPRFRENENEEKVYLTAMEERELKMEASAFMDEVRSCGQDMTLDEMNNEKYVPTELVADRRTLEEKLPEGLGDVAFSMRQNEIGGLYETEDAYYIFDCVEQTEENSTNAAKVEIIENREKALFEESYSQWQEKTVIKTNYVVWDELKFPASGK